MAHDIYKDIQLRKDGSYVCIYSGVPYHIPNGYGYEKQWAEVTAHVLIHPEDIRDYIEPEANIISSMEKPLYIRGLRDKRILDIEPRINRYKLQKEAGVPTKDTDEWYQEALLYLEELRNVPDQEGFPDNVVWPESPDSKIYGIPNDSNPYF